MSLNDGSQGGTGRGGSETSRIIIAVVLSIGMMLVYSKYTESQKAKATTQPAASAPSHSGLSAPAASASSAAATSASSPSATSASASGPAMRAVGVADKKTVTIGGGVPVKSLKQAMHNDGYQSSITFTNVGGSISDVDLVNFANSIDKPEVGYRVLSPVELPGGTLFSMMTRSITIREANQADVFVDLDAARWNSETKRTDKNQTVRFWVDVCQGDTPIVTIEKTYTLTKGSFDLAVNLRAINKSGRELSFFIDQYGPAGVKPTDPRNDTYRMTYVATIGNGDERRRVSVGRLTHDQVQKTSDLMQPMLESGRSIVWAGQANKYFAAFLAVTDKTPAAIERVDGRSFTRKKELGEDLTTEWQTRETTLAADASTEWTFELYLGPKCDTLFNDTPIYHERYYAGTIEYPWCTMQWLTELMMAFLQLIYKFIGNYGVAIILMVLIVRVLLHPVTKSSQKSMMRMQKDMKKLQPKMAVLKEKYKDDRAALNRETMELYKQEGINPAGQMMGCLPMLVQMPIWVALYTSLNMTFELRHEPFFWFVKDLSSPDTLWNFGQEINIPLLSAMMGPVHGLNVLPIIMGFSMWLQQKITPTAADADPDQAKQQKIMFVMMSVMMTLVLYNAPSGLNLYILTSSFIGYFESRHIRKQLENEPERVKTPIKSQPNVWERMRQKVEKMAQEYDQQGGKKRK